MKKTKTAILALVYLSLIPVIASCGIKPKEVDPPANVTNDNFPRVYPDPSMDPANHALSSEEKY